MQSYVPASAKILFISDAHLGAFSPPKNKHIEQEIIALIDYADKHDFEIVVLGDLFDYWIEYPGYTPALGEKMLQRFREFHRNGKSSLYITGNHDNWTLGYFKECGFDVEPDYRILHINGQSVLLVHGDATGPDLKHLARPFFHRFIRNTVFLKCYRWLLPPRAGVALMRNFSRFSSTFEIKDEDTAFLNRWAEHMLNESNIDYIMCGHDHCPRHLNFDFGTYINLGTFHEHHSLAVYTNCQFELVNWNSDNQELTPIKSQAPAHE